VLQPKDTASAEKHVNTTRVDVLRTDKTKKIQTRWLVEFLNSKVTGTNLGHFKFFQKVCLWLLTSVQLREKYKIATYASHESIKT